MDSAKKWIKLTITANPILVETLGDYLVGIHNMGVEVIAEDEIPTGVITAFAKTESLPTGDSNTLTQQVLEYGTDMAKIFNTLPPTVAWEFFGEEDWGEKWKQHFKPFAIVPGLTIAPTWEEYQKQENELVIEMDPGMVFGTGHHATTSLTLEFIQEIIAKQNCQTVLDVGCGTGILTIGAALFGAKKCLGVDNCQDAVKVAQNNVTYNSQSNIVNISITPVEELCENFDLVVANIIHDVLASMADSLTAATKENGFLVLSGVLRENQADSIAEIFREKGFTLLEKRERDEWAAVLLQKSTLFR